MMGGRFRSRLRRAVLGFALFFLLFETVSGSIPLPVAVAQNGSTYSQLCASSGTQFGTTSVSAGFVAPYVSGVNIHDVGAKITATISNAGSVTRAEALIYRATTRDDAWSRVATIRLTSQILNSWAGEYTGTLPNGTYRLFAQVKGYGINPLTNKEEALTQGCSTAQTVAKGPSESDTFCAGTAAAQSEIGLTTSIRNTKIGKIDAKEPAEYEIKVSLNTGLRNASTPELDHKRSPKGAEIFTTVQDNVPLGNAQVNGNTKTWSVTAKESPPSPGDYDNYAFVSAFVNGKKYTTCAHISHHWGNANEEVGDEEVDLETLRKWFGKDENDLRIIVPTGSGDSGKKPSVDVPVDEETGRPRITFELAYIFGNGGNILESVTSPIDSRQLDFTMFQAYMHKRDSNNDPVKKRIPGVFYVHDDRGLDGHVEYWPNEADAATRRNDSNKETLQTGWDVTKESYTDLYARIYNEPKDSGSDNCLDKDGVIKIGPVGDGKEAEKEISSRGYETANLNGNCINAYPYGWPAFWGVPVQSIPLDLSKSCAVKGFLSLFSEGIGVMIAKMLGCLAAAIFEGVLNTVQPLLCEAASRSMLIPGARAATSSTAPQDCNSIKNQSPIQSESHRPRQPSYAPDSPPERQTNNFVSFFIGTAHAQNIGSAHNFENELKNPNSVIVRIWGYARSLLNVIVIAALLAIAFANIFHINMNTYAAKKMLPGLVIGVIAANGSLLIIRFLADVTQAVSQLAVDMSGRDNAGITTLIAWHFPMAIGEAGIVGVIGSLVVAGATAPFTGGLSLLGWVLLMLGLVIYYVFLIVAFAFAFIKRVVILYFLSMMAPLAFVAYGVPQFQKYFYQWWDHFLRQLFVFPIILFGMSATIVIADQLGIADYANVLNPTNFISGLVSIFIVMAAATMVLKLPKIVTKGALDVASTFKKAIAAAPRIAQGIQGANAMAGKYRTNKLTKDYEAAKKLGTPEGRRLAAELRLKRMKIAESTKSREGKIKKFRGYSTLFARPELLQDAWNARGEKDRKDDYIGAMTRTGGVVGMLRGPAAEAELAKKLGTDELKDARTKGDLKDWADTLGEGHIKNVEDNLKIREAMKKAAKGNAGRFEELRQKAANLKSQGEIDDFTKLLSKETGMNIGATSVKDYHDIMKWSAYQAAVTRVSRGIRDTEEGVDPYLKGARKASLADPRYSLMAPPAGGGGPTPFAGAAQVSATKVAQFTDEQIQQRVEEIFSHGAALDPNLGEELQEKFVKNLDTLSDLELMNPAEGTFATALENTRQTLLDAVGTSTGAEADALREAIRQANDPAQLTRLTENLSLAAAARSQGDLSKESIASIVAQASEGTRGFHQQHSQMMDGIDYNRLENAITSSLQAGGEDLGEILKNELGAGVDKMSAAIGKKLNPEEQRKLFQQLGTQIQTTMVGPGQKTLRAVLQSTVSSLPKVFAKSVGVHTLKPSAMSAQVHAPQPPPTPPTPPPTPES